MGSQLLQVITPDWQATWSAKEAEEQLNGFQVKGPGWYFKDGSSMLVIGTDMPDVYTFLVYFNRDPRTAYGGIAEAPIQLSEGQPSKIKDIAGLIILFVGMMIMIPIVAVVSAKFGMPGLLIAGVVVFVLARMGRNVYDRKHKEEKT